MWKKILIYWHASVYITPIYADLHTCLDEVEADVLLDLTTPEVGKTTRYTCS